MLFAAITLIYALIVAGITIYTSHKQAKGDIDSFIANKGGMTIFSAIAMVIGAYTAGSGTVGSAEAGYTIGITAIWPMLAGSIGIIVGVAFGISKFYRVMAIDGCLSMHEALGRYFSQRVRTLMAFITVFAYMGMFAIQPTAIAGVLCPAFGWDFKTVMWLGGIFCIFIGVMGGIKTVTNANVFNTLVLYFSLGIGALLVVKYIGGGFEAVNSSLPESYLTPVALGWQTIGAYLITSFGFTINPMGICPVFGCSNLKKANKSLILSAILILPLSVAIAYIGMSGKAAGIEIKGVDAIYSLTNMISPALSAVANVGILAAIISTAPMLVMSAGGIVAHDVYASFIRKNASAKEQILVAKIATIVIGVFGILVGTSIPSIMSGLMAAIQMSSVPAVIIFTAILWGGIDERAAFWGILSSGLVSIIWYFLKNPGGIQGVWPALAVGVTVVAIFVARSRGKSYAGHIKYREELNYLTKNNQL